jgi:hypothetical protein
MKRVTVDDIMAAGPCSLYPRERVVDLWAGRESLTAREIANLKIPVLDRLWAIILCCLDDRQRRLFACDCAERALALVKDLDLRSVEAIRVSRLYAVGEATGEQLAAAMAVAGAAARAAARDVARYEARAAAWYAAMAAAGDAAWYAAWYAAWAAAWDVAWDAARDAAWYAAMVANLGLAVKYAEEEAK